MTARALRMVLGLIGEKSLIDALGQTLGLTLQQSLNKPKQDGSESRSYRLTVSLVNPAFFCNSHFNILFDTLKGYTTIPTVKQVRLWLVEEFLKLSYPLITQKNNIVVDEHCISFLLVWCIWPIAHKNREYIKYLAIQD